MKYVQNTEEKSIFAKLYEDDPLEFLKKRIVDTIEARKKIKALRKKLDKIESLIDEVESWKLFKDELPKPKKHVLVKEICSDEYMKEYECEEWERNVYSTLFIDGDNMVRGGDMFGGFSYPVKEIHKLDNYYWKYIEK